MCVCFNTESKLFEGKNYNFYVFISCGVSYILVCSDSVLSNRTFYDGVFLSALSNMAVSH